MYLRTHSFIALQESIELGLGDPPTFRSLIFIFCSLRIYLPGFGSSRKNEGRMIVSSIDRMPIQKKRRHQIFIRLRIGLHPAFRADQGDFKARFLPHFPQGGLIGILAGIYVTARRTPIIIFFMKTQ